MLSTTDAKFNFGECHVRRALRSDVYELGPKLRDQDRLELSYLGLVPNEGLLASYENSKRSWSFLHYKSIICMFGVSYGREEKMGKIWMLGSDLLYNHRKDFLMASRVWVNEMKKGHELLENMVIKSHKEAIDWLAWLGFLFDKQEVSTSADHLYFYMVTSG